MLTVSGVSKSFGGVNALDSVDLEVRGREIVGLIGPNGAGKTTLFNCLAGELKPDQGEVDFEGIALNRIPAHRRAGLGIARTFQNVGMARSLTVLENLLLSQHSRARYSVLNGILGMPSGRREEKAMRKNAIDLADACGLTSVLDSRLPNLPYGTLKAVEVACALAMEPTLLLLDEPASGLSPSESAELGRRLLQLREQLGITMLVIEHHVPLVTAVCDYVYVLNYGTVITHGLPSEVQRHPGVIEAYLGEHGDSTLRRVGPAA